MNLQAILTQSASWEHDPGRPAVTSRDKSCFSFFGENRPAHGLDEAVDRYRAIAPLVRLAMCEACWLGPGPACAGAHM